MKRLILLSSLMFFGFASSGYAQHCTVQKGDSIWKIAKIYNHDFHEVLKLNKHLKNPHLIYPNQKIELPDGNSSGNATTTPSNNVGNNISQHDVKSTEATEILNLVNQERAKHGLASLTLSSKLTSVATTKAYDMKDNNYFSHTSPNYGSPFQMMQDFGIKYSNAGENIAGGQKTPQEVMSAWLNSSGHRANILNKNYTQLGVGYAKGGSYGSYWVQMFIKP